MPASQNSSKSVQRQKLDSHLGQKLDSHLEQQQKLDSQPRPQIGVSA